MAVTTFEDYLKTKKLADDKISAAIEMVQELSEFLQKSNRELDQMEFGDIHRYSAYLIEKQTNLYMNYVYILYYGYFRNNHKIVEPIMELLDGAEMFPNFAKQLEEWYGKDVRSEIFQEIDMPPLGLHPKKRPDIIKILVARVIDKFGPGESIRFFKVGLRDKYPQSYKKPKEDLAKLKDIDKFLKLKHQNFVKTIEKHFHENTLFFSQPIDENVINFVKEDQMISAGIRDGNTIVMKKIPYKALPALKETDIRKKRYYICHNPLIREALLTEDQPISPIFCNCSGGFMKNFWEAMFDCSVDVELLESVIIGDEVCKFAIHIPENIIEKFIPSA
ncbi:MAG: DUF6144 family protein [Promethearchaeota archaeon]